MAKEEYYVMIRNPALPAAQIGRHDEAWLITDQGTEVHIQGIEGTKSRRECTPDFLESWHHNKVDWIIGPNYSDIPPRSICALCEICHYSIDYLCVDCRAKIG